MFHEHIQNERALSGKPDQPQFTITKEQLTENGWTFNENGFPFYAQKDLTEGPDAEDKIQLVLHGWNGRQDFALLLPDGGMVNIGPYTIEELNLFERMILSYEPNY